MNLLPDKITPDHLKDTIVEYRFLSDYPSEILAGLIYQELKSFSFSIVPRPLPSHSIKLDRNHTILVGGTDNVLFANDYVKIQLQVPESILVFNSLDQYPGWESYSNCLDEIINNLFAQKLVKAISRIGIRYISEFPNMSVFDIMNYNPTLPLPLGEGQNITYKAEIRHEDYTVVLNLADRVYTSPDHFFSLVDIDVFNTFPQHLYDVEHVLKTTSALHTIEKQVFFGILKDEYLQTLNPEYKK